MIGTLDTTFCLTLWIDPGALPRACWAALGSLRREGCDDSATDCEQHLELRWLKPDHSTIVLQLRASCLCIPVAAE